MKDRILCILDIGSWNIHALAVKLVKNCEIEQLYFGNSHSIGIEKGEVTNLNYLSDSIEQAISKVEQQLRRRIYKVIICIGGDHIKGYYSKGMITISELGAEIKHSDVEKAIHSAKLLSIPMDRKVLHIYQQDFRVNGQSNITMPVGMFGNKLEANLYIITAVENKVQNIIKAVNNIGLQVERVVFSGFMNIYGLLSEEERKRGGVILDIGAGTTNVIAVKEGKFLCTEIFPFGSIELTKQIKKELKIPFQEAERRKKGIISFYPKSDIERAVSLGSIEKKIIEIIYRIMRKSFEEIKQKLDGQVLDLASECFIITGGTALMGGVLELAEDIFNVKASIANPKIFNSDGNNNRFLNSGQYSASVGALNVLLEEEKAKYSGSIGKIYVILNRIKDFFCEYF